MARNLSKDRKTKQALADSIMRLMLKKSIDHITINEIVARELEFAIDFYVTACVKKTAQWVEGGCKKSSEELALEFLECLPDKLKKYMLTEEDIQVSEKIREKHI